MGRIDPERSGGCTGVDWGQEAPQISEERALGPISKQNKSGRFWAALTSYARALAVVAVDDW